MGKRKDTHELPNGIKVQLVERHANQQPAAAPPYALRFTTGFQPVENDESKCTWQVLAKPGARGARQQTIVANTEHVDFVGTIAAPVRAPVQRMYIGVFDKQHGTLTVTPTPPQGIITMAPAYHNPHLDTLRTVSAIGADALSSVKEQRARTNAQLSRVTAATTHGHATVASLLTEQADQAQRAQRTRADLELAAEANRLLPPCNKDATVLGEAYVWEEVVPRGAWSGVLTTRLMSAAKNAVVRSALQEEGNVPGFVVEQLEGLGRVGDVGVRTHKTKLLALVGVLLKLAGKGGRLSVKVNGVPMTDIADVAQALDIEEPVLKHMVPLFYTQDTQGVWHMSKPQRDLLHSYLLVLVMLFCEGRLHAEGFASLRLALGYDTKELIKRFRLIGATVKKAPGKDQGHIALLLTDGRTLQQSLPPVQQRAIQRR